MRHPQPGSSSADVSAGRQANRSARELVGREHELATLEQLLETVRNGGSGTILVRGEPGVGKSALLERLIGSASGFRIVRAVGVEREVDLPYAGLQQLFGSTSDTIDVLPPPQRRALQVAFGLSSGDAPDRYLVGLAVLNVLSEAASVQPLLCVVDDAQWLDTETTQALAFVARRLGADTVALMIASREHVDDFDGLPAMHLGGLGIADARALLDSVVVGRLDEAVRERFLAETRGNPLALLELPHALTPAEAATGILGGSSSLSERIEDSFRRRLEPLPVDTRRLLVLASAEPLGDPLLLLRAAVQLGLRVEAADAAEEAGLLEIRERCSFRHPLVRSAVYRAATQLERRQAHGALAEATDPQLDPDRRAWHRAQATAAPDEDVAAELERTAVRARARGGLAATAAFLERAAALTAEPARRSERALSAAQVKYEAGLLDDALTLLTTAEIGPLDDGQRSWVLLLRARIAFTERHTSEARPLLVEAGRSAEATDVNLARLAYLEAFHAAMHDGRLAPEGMAEVSAAVLACPPPQGEPRPRDLLLDGLATRTLQGYAAGAPLLKQALVAFRRETDLPAEDTHWVFLATRVASDLWDDDAHAELLARELERARQTGALAALPTLLDTRGTSHVIGGEMEEAASVLDEARAVREATGIKGHGDGGLFLAAMRGREAEAVTVITHAAERAAAHRDGLGLAAADYCTAMLYNGLGRYQEAMAAAREAGEHPYEIGTSTRAVAELVEAATRSGADDVAGRALERLTQISGASGTPWALGVEARSRALLSEGTVAEDLYCAAIETLRGTRLRPELARTRLLYGEWLRREGRRADAREQLRTAYESFTEMGILGFADRAQRELAATGATARKRTDDTRADLTAQEVQIARLALGGLTNPQIGAQLFLSPRTVEWHLRHIYPKLGIGSRRELHRVAQRL
ncbi:MAG TPA: AAA family ATPase [Gaiellaceae bacterium]|nr:AAA family ATPase [Gaiellaceae bacterium]